MIALVALAVAVLLVWAWAHKRRRRGAHAAPVIAVMRDNATVTLPRHRFRGGGGRL